MLKIYSRLRFKSIGPLNYNLFNRLFTEIEIVIATILVQLSLKTNLSANKVDFISVSISYLLVLIYCFVTTGVIRFLIYGYFLFIHSWDIADGEIARINKKTGLFGHIIDELSLVLNISAVYFLLAINQINRLDSVFYIIVVLLISMRNLRIKDLFYRIFNESNYHSSLNIGNSPLISDNKPSKLMLLVKFAISNDYRFIVIFLIVDEITRLNLSFIILIGALFIQISRIILDILWVLSKESILSKSS
jgi:hypothetical protein